MLRLAVTCQPKSFVRIFVAGFAASVMSLGGTAVAQTHSLPKVRVLRDNLEIKQWRSGRPHVTSVASAGTMLDVLSTDGDMYVHRESNWYFVLFPPDAWGTRRPGWISGRNVEYIPGVPFATVAPPVAVMVEPPPAVTTPPAPPRVESPMPAAEARAAATNVPAVSEVVLYFDFGKSNLTDESKGKLAAAFSTLKPNEVNVSFALEGHADWIGTGKFNERLGLARAEMVKQFLNDQFKIPADKIGVVSFGEDKPAAPNSTDEGRALNRRVLIKVGA
jgi:peptidoglycan-associated lipoprotein